MAINIGAMLAPSMAKWITNVYLSHYGLQYNAANTDPSYLQALSGAYGLCFGVACISLILSAVIYFAFRGWFKHADVTAKQAKEQAVAVEELTPRQRERMVAGCYWCLPWLSSSGWHSTQNRSASTFFAKYTDLTVSGTMRIGFNIFSFALAISVYTGFATFQSKSTRSRAICGVATVLLLSGAYALYAVMDNPTYAQPSDFRAVQSILRSSTHPIQHGILRRSCQQGQRG